MKKLYTIISLSVITLLSTGTAKATIHLIFSQSTPTEGFFPASFIAQCGDTIRWKNTNGTHTTASTSIPGTATPWASGNITANPGFSIVVTVVGTYNYTCHPATPHMPASFTVQCSSGLPVLNFNFVNVAYPNPSTGKITIEAKGDLTIYNMVGEAVLSQTLTAEKTEIDLSTKPKGIYFVYINSENGSITKKIMIQ